jgi:hypothetical protein
MSIIAICPACGTNHEVPESAAGAKGKCRSCGAAVHVPRRASESDGIAHSIATPNGNGQRNLTPASTPQSGSRPSAVVPLPKPKFCSVCGKDITDVKRIKDSQGAYYCHSCWAATVQATQHSIQHQDLNNSTATAHPIHEVKAAIARPISQEPIAENITSQEKYFIVGGVVAALLLGLGLVYFLFVRTWWEDHNDQMLIALKADAESLVKQGMLSDAHTEYERMFSIVGEHVIRNALLKEAIASARVEDSDVVSKMTAADHAREQAQQQRLAAAQEARQEREQQVQIQQAAQQQEAVEAQAQAEKDRLKPIFDDLFLLAKLDHDADVHVANSDLYDNKSQSAHDAGNTDEEVRDKTLWRSELDASAEDNKRSIEIIGKLSNYPTSDYLKCLNDILNDDQVSDDVKTYLRPLAK